VHFFTVRLRRPHPSPSHGGGEGGECSCTLDCLLLTFAFSESHFPDQFSVVFSFFFFLLGIFF
jgi:hypothetical protein